MVKERTRHLRFFFYLFMFECLCERKDDLVTGEPTGSNAWNSEWSGSERCSTVSINAIVCPLSSVFSQEPNQYKGWYILQVNKHKLENGVKKTLKKLIHLSQIMIYKYLQQHRSFGAEDTASKARKKRVSVLRAREFRRGRVDHDSNILSPITTHWRPSIIRKTIHSVIETPEFPDKPI